MNKQKIYSIILLLFFTTATYAQLATPQVLSSNMVLQQNQKVPIWGTAEPNERVQILFGKQKIAVRADKDGRWMAELQPLKADKNPQTLTVKGQKTSLVYDNVLVGEVWLCSGQSNMEYSMKRYHTFLPPAKGEDLEALERKKPANDMIRVFVSDRQQSWNSWKIADGESLEKVSSAGYFFGKAIQEKLDVPVGIITCALGGTLIEAWTTTGAYEKSPVFASQLKANDGKIDGFRPGNWYDQLLKPLIPFGVKGFLWYQGENNCGKADRMYAEKYRVLVESWRDVFNLPHAPFYSVLLAPHIYSDRTHRGKSSGVTAEELPIFREEQRKGTTLVANSEYVVITDLVDDLKDIHPPYKWEVGARLARLALAKTYAVDTVWSGPRVNSTEIDGDKIVVSFDNCADSLKINDGKRLTWFEIANENGVFRPALADIKDKTKVVVYHPEIKQPAKVRFGWHEAAVPNLVNSEGLPATPFVTTSN